MSSIAELETHLGEVLTTEFEDTPTTVVLGYDESAKEQVAIGDLVLTSEWQTFGPTPVRMKVEYSIELIIEVMARSGKNQKPAVQRAWEILDLIDSTIRATHQLDGMSYDALIKKGTKEFFEGVNKTKGCRIRVTVEGTLSQVATPVAP